MGTASPASIPPFHLYLAPEILRIIRFLHLPRAVYPGIRAELGVLSRFV